MTNHLKISGITNIVGLSDASTVSIAFVGSKMHFPDCLFRMIGAEIDGSATQRLPAPVDLATAMMDRAASPNLVIVDESLWDQMDAALLNGLRLDAGAAVAIAFRDPARIARLPGGPPKGVSFLPMDLNIESWLTILRLMLTGYVFVPSEFQVLEAQRAQSAPPPLPAADMPAAKGALDRLTRREHEVLALVAEGFQNKHIAERLALSEHTVKLHLHHVISKLGARNRTDAALRYRREVAS
jgi:DNA-binding NarL/FixJ family response regulator